MFKKIILFFIDEIPIFISRLIYKIAKIKSDKVILHIYHSVQFFMWISFYGFVAYKFKLLFNFFMFIFLFAEIRNRFELLSEETKVSYKVLHSTVLGCFFLTFAHILNFLIFSFVFKNIFLQIIFSIFIALNTINFSSEEKKIKTNEDTNGLMGRRNKFFETEEKIIKFYITNQKNDFAITLENAFEMYPNCKEICEMYYKKKFPITKIAMKMGYSYDTIISNKNKFLATMEKYSMDSN